MKYYIATLSYLDTTKLFWFLSFIIVALVALYFTFVNLAVFHTARREAALEEARFLSGEIAELEFSYLRLESALTLEKALALGFEDVEDRTVFVFMDSNLGEEQALAQNVR
jgi:hypothetical protein